MRTNPLNAQGSDKSTLKARYEQYRRKRENYLHRAYEYAKTTLPYILPEHSYADGETMQQGWQGFGARVVNHLSNKIIMTLFPPSRTFFKLDFSSDVNKELQEEG